MATPTRFTDSKGDTWDVALSVGMLEKLLHDADFDLDALIESPDAMSAKLFKSPRVFAQALWVLCEEQATGRGLDGRGFGMRLDREALDRATEAFFEAVVLFYPRSSAGRAIRGRIPELFRRMDREEERRVNEYLDRVMAADGSPDSSGTAGGSPGSSALTPAG